MALISHCKITEPRILGAELIGAGEGHAPLTLNGLEFIPDRRKWHNHRHSKEKKGVWRPGT